MCNKEKFWPELCQVLGRDDWLQDTRFENFKARLEHRAQLQDLLDKELIKKTTADWLDTFERKVPAAPIYDIQQALENPFVTDESRLQDLDLDGYGSYRAIDTPIKCGEPTPANPAPVLGQHTEELLQDLGYNQEKMTKLKQSKIV